MYKLFTMSIILTLSIVSQAESINKGYVVGTLSGVNHMKARAHMRSTKNAGILYSCRDVKINERTGSFKATGSKPLYVIGVPAGLTDSYWDAETAALAGKNVIECTRKVANTQNKGFSNY